MDLVRHCVAGTGTVHVSVELKFDCETAPRINIVDILQPATELLEEDSSG